MPSATTELPRDGRQISRLPRRSGRLLLCWRRPRWRRRRRLLEGLLQVSDKVVSILDTY